MRYYVIAEYGQKYGPADLQTLQAWVTEGRILHTTVLEEEGTAVRVSASGLGSLRMGTTAATAPPPDPQSPYGQTNPYQSNPYQQPANYYRPGASFGDPIAQKHITNGWIGFAVGLACCAPVAIWGILEANKAKALGHPQGETVFIANIVALILGVGWVGLNGIDIIRDILR